LDLRIDLSIAQLKKMPAKTLAACTYLPSIVSVFPSMQNIAW